MKHDDNDVGGPVSGDLVQAHRASAQDREEQTAAAIVAVVIRSREVAVTDPDDVDGEPSDDDYEQPEDSLPLEAEPADAMEQHREVPQDDDDYR